MGGTPQRDGTIFYGGSWLLKTPYKYFSFAIGGGTKYMKSLENGAKKGLIFHAIIPALYPWKFYWLNERIFIFSLLEP